VVFILVTVQISSTTPDLLLIQ